MDIHLLEYMFYIVLNSWAWWHMPVTPAFGRLRQKNHDMEATFGYIEIFRVPWATQGDLVSNRTNKIKIKHFREYI